MSILLQSLPAPAQVLVLLNLFQNALFFLATPAFCQGVDRQVCSQSSFFHHGNTMVLAGCYLPK